MYSLSLFLMLQSLTEGQVACTQRGSEVLPLQQHTFWWRILDWAEPQQSVSFTPSPNPIFKINIFILLKILACFPSTASKTQLLASSTLLKLSVLSKTTKNKSAPLFLTALLFSKALPSALSTLNTQRLQNDFCLPDLLLTNPSGLLRHLIFHLPSYSTAQSSHFQCRLGKTSSPLSSFSPQRKKREEDKVFCAF